MWGRATPHAPRRGPPSVRMPVVGVSVQTAAQALAAQKAGADYLGAGAVFGTPTKTDAVVTGVDGFPSSVRR